MTHLVTFVTSDFDVSSERPNPINPIAGESVLKWLREKLMGAGYDVTAPEPEDWGWYVQVRESRTTFLVGASSEIDQPNPREWTIQIHRKRSLLEKLTGRGKLSGTEQLVSQIERLVRERPGVENVQVERSG